MEPKSLIARGFHGRENSLVYFCPSQPTHNVVFFQGDTQVGIHKSTNESNCTNSTRSLTIFPAGLSLQNGGPVRGDQSLEELEPRGHVLSAQREVPRSFHLDCASVNHAALPVRMFPQLCKELHYRCTGVCSRPWRPAALVLAA